jgi:hypothetical protein
MNVAEWRGDTAMWGDQEAYCPRCDTLLVVLLARSRPDGTWHYEYRAWMRNRERRHDGRRQVVTGGYVWYGKPAHRSGSAVGLRFRIIELLDGLPTMRQFPALFDCECPERCLVYRRGETPIA